MSKLPTVLEREGQRQAKASSSLMSHFIGQTLRYLHYCFQAFVSTETDPVVLNQSLRAALTLLQVTPYHNMCPGLASDLVARIVGSVKVT